MTQLWSSRDFAAHDFPDPPYLVKPVIPLGGIAMLHGKPGIGKSQMVLTMAEAINQGKPLFGRWPVRQGPVVVVQADMTGKLQQVRVRRAVERTDIEDTYWVAEEDGSVPQVDITKMIHKFRTLVGAIRELEPVLVVWDTLRKVHRLPMNDDSSPVAVYGAAQELFPSATHQFIHHNRQQAQDPQIEEIPDEGYMGSVQWKGSADTTWELVEIDTAPKRLLCRFHKVRTGPDWTKEPFVLEMDPQTLLLRPVGRACRTERIRRNIFELDE